MELTEDLLTGVKEIDTQHNELYYLLHDWIIYHIREWDKAMAAYISKHIRHLMK